MNVNGRLLADCRGVILGSRFSAGAINSVKVGESMTVSIGRFSRLRGDVEIIRKGILHEVG